jgi:hypothetical protein
MYCASSHSETVKDTTEAPRFKETSAFSEQLNPNPEEPGRKPSTRYPNSTERAEELRVYLHRTKHLKWMSFLKERKEEYLGRLRTTN